MKVILILLMLCVFVCRLAAQQKLEYHVNSEVAGGKDDLFVKAVSWAVIQGDADITTIQYEDKEAGRLIIKYKMSVAGIRDVLGFKFGADHVYYYMTIDTRDNKYRMNLSNFQHIGGDYKAGFRLTVLWHFGRKAPSYGSLDKVKIHRWIDGKRWKKIRKQATEKAGKQLQEFQDAMQKAEPVF